LMMRVEDRDKLINKFFSFLDNKRQNRVAHYI
jgi:hypothetical protein